jgi:SAM-dependent methyltransferase
MYRNPREEADDVRRSYESESMDPAVSETLLRIQENPCAAQAKRLAAFAGRVNHGIEVGSYVGGFLGAARRKGMHFRGFDVNASAVNFARSRGLDAEVGSMDSIPRDEQFDAIVILNTFEQLPDVRAAARAAQRHLRERGALVVRVPNAGFYRTWRERLRGRLAPLALRLLAFNNLLGFPYREGFSAKSLRRLLADSGFRVTHVYGDVALPSGDEWLHAKAPFEEGMLRRLQKTLQRNWNAPWVEVYARAT